jgi:pimeloyl-ACP methyl ester carboxylesterase
MTNLLHRVTREAQSAAVRALYRLKGRPPAEDVPARKTLTLQDHLACQIETKMPVEIEELHKENWVVQDAADPDHFNHFLAHIFHPGRLNPDLPVLLLVPGMLCNGNFFRVSPHERNFRNLSSPSSFANALAYEGFHVVIANPRYGRWIYSRYVSGKLGVKNYFSEAVDFERLVGDLAFYLDAAIGLSRAKAGAVLGFSLGGMELMHYLATRPADPRLTHAVFMGAPAEFSRRQTLIMLLTIYNWLAKFTPLRNYQALELTARNLIPLKQILAKLPPGMIAGIPLAEELFNPEQVNPEEIIPFITYVLEPMPSPLITFLIETAARGGFLDLSRLSGCRIPSLVVGGDRDGLVSAASNQRLIEAIGSPQKELKVIEGTGHLDLVTGLKFRETVQAVVDFIPPK